jgi:hypothetical protein
MNSQKKKPGTTDLWNAVVELDQFVSDDLADELMDALAEYAASVGGGPHNHTLITVTVPAASIRQAFTTAVAVTEAATGSTAVGVEVLPTEDFDARSGLESIPALSSVQEAADVLGLSRVRVAQMVTEGKFSTARKVGGSYVIAYREVANMAGIRDPLDKA